jgi:phage FluMu protein Com
MLRVSDETRGYLEVKCPRCKMINRVTVSPAEQYETRRAAHGGNFR